jgi:hypothetical protein
VWLPNNVHRTAREATLTRRLKAGSRAPLTIGLAFAVVAAFTLGPDLVRYMKIRAM